MDLIQVFTNNIKNITVNIKGTIEEPLFQANQIGELLELKNIRKSIIDFDADEKIDVTGSYTNDVIRTATFLTELGLYRLLGQSRKPIARDFQKWVATVIKQIRLNGKYELENKVLQIETNHKKNAVLIKHETLKHAYAKQHAVYFAIVLYLNENEWVIKIGATKDTDDRATRLSSQFTFFAFTDIFPCINYFEFEKHLHNRDDIKIHKYVDDIPPGVRSKETFKVNKELYAKFVNIAKDEVKSFNQLTHDQKIELQKLEVREKEIELEMKKCETEVMQLQINTPQTIENESDSDESDEDLLELPSELLYKTRKLSNGHKLQKYNLEGHLLQTYAGVMDAVRKCPGTSKSQLRIAYKNNTVYKGFRWMKLALTLPDDTVQDIGISTERKSVPVKSMIAMLNLDKNRIENVFPDQKSAAQAMKFTSTASISQAIKFERRCSGHYFKPWDTCSNELKSEFLKQNVLPEQRKSKGTRILQLHPITNAIIKEFDTMDDAIQKYQMGRQTFKNALENDEIYKSYKWCYKPTKDKELPQPEILAQEHVELQNTVQYFLV
jgi:prophage antirepressor-like protein